MKLQLLAAVIVARTCGALLRSIQLHDVPAGNQTVCKAAANDTFIADSNHHAKDKNGHRVILVTGNSSSTNTPGDVCRDCYIDCKNDYPDDPCRCWYWMGSDGEWTASDSELMGPNCKQLCSYGRCACRPT